MALAAREIKYLQAPFPWFGGKSRVAADVWQRFGDPPNYVEPFFGSGAVLLRRPGLAGQIETVNDLDGYVANFWRAVAADTEAVAHYADWPVNENDLHARHAWLVNNLLPRRLEGDPDFYDAKIAGWWAWGICCWIGGEFCSGIGPWRVDGNGELAKAIDNAPGVRRRLPAMTGMGVHRQLPGKARGVQTATPPGIYEWFEALRARLRRVWVCCGDWSRIMGPSVTYHNGLTGVFLDPPYSAKAGRDMGIYHMDCGEVAHAVREWALANGDNPLLRIALCGYEGEHAMPPAWKVYAWKANGGYGNQSKNGNANAGRERIWFSPHCLDCRQGELF